LIVPDTHIWVWWVDDLDKMTVSQRGHVKANEAAGLGVSAISCWEVAKLVGLEDVGTPCVIREVKGQKGAVQDFNVGYMVAHKANEKGIGVYGSPEDTAKIAAFDYVIGNEDRHSGNWMVNEKGKIRLIDHGACFPENSKLNGNMHFIREAQKKQYDLDSSIKGVYREKKTAILQSLTTLGLPTKAVSEVGVRIDGLLSARNFDSLRGTQQW